MGIEAALLRAEVGRLQRVGSGGESPLLGAAIERPLLVPESPSEPRPGSTATAAEPTSSVSASGWLLMRKRSGGCSAPKAAIAKSEVQPRKRT